MTTSGLLTVLAVAFLVSLLATPVLRAAAWRLGVLDHPGPRSSHQAVTPRAGGLAILLATTASLLAVGRAGDALSGYWAVLAGGLLVAGVGLADDRYGLPPFPRLAVHLLAASGVVWAIGGFDRLPLPPPVDLPLGMAGSAITVVWIVGLVNLYNFMDGIDGLAGLQAVVTAGAVALAFASGAPVAAALAAALAGASAAFLVYNWSPASVFLGDAGSGLLGYTLAVLGLLAPSGRESEATLMIVASLGLFLSDAVTCLGRRVATGARWHEPHREHLYQRWVAVGASHARVAFWIGGGALVLAGLALLGWRTGEAAWYWAALGASGLMLAAEWTVVRRREEGRARC